MNFYIKCVIWNVTLVAPIISALRYLNTAWSVQPFHWLNAIQPAVSKNSCIQVAERICKVRHRTDSRHILSLTLNLLQSTSVWPDVSSVCSSFCWRIIHSRSIRQVYTHRCKLMLAYSDFHFISKPTMTLL